MRAFAVVRMVGVSLCAAIVACSKSGDQATDVPAPTVATIALTASVPSLAVRQTAAVVPDFRDTAGKVVVGVTGVVWTSSDPGTISVDQAGTVTALKLGGPVTITATLAGVVGHATLSVTPIYQFSPALTTLLVDSTATLSVISVDFYGVTLSTITPSWSTSDPSIARVDNAGHVTGVSAGNVGIVATFNGLPLSLTIEVGAPSPLDGTWTGTVAPTITNARATVVIYLGVVRSVRLTPLSGSGGSGFGCTATVNTDVNIPVSSDQFTVGAAFNANMSGHFVDASTLDLAIAPFTVPASAYTCQNNFTSLATPYGPFAYILTRS